MSSLLLVGYFGSGNLGDEMILAAAAERLHREFPEWELYAVAHDSEGWVHDAVQPVPKRAFATVSRHCFSAEAAVWPGGSVVQNRTSSRSLFYYWTLATMLASFSTPQYMLGQGYGPVRGTIPLRWAKDVLRAQERISARDQESFKQMAMLLGPNEKMHLGGDTALIAEDGELPPPEEGRVLAVFPKGDPGRWSDQVLDSLCEWLDGRSYALRAVPSHPEQDTPAAERLCEFIGGQGLEAELYTPDPRKPHEAVRGAGLAVSQRFHGVITACRQGIPTVIVGDDPKLISAQIAMEIPRVDEPESDIVTGLRQLQRDYTEASGRVVSWISLAASRAAESWDDLARSLRTSGE